MVTYTLRIPPSEGRLRGMLYELNCITEQSYSEQGDWMVDITMLTADWHRIDKKVEHKLSGFVVR
jgi:GTP-binding protein HflX